MYVGYLQVMCLGIAVQISGIISDLSTDVSFTNIPIVSASLQLPVFSGYVL